MMTVTPVFCDWLTVTVGDLLLDRYVSKHLLVGIGKQIRAGAYGMPNAVQFEPFGIRYYFNARHDIDGVLVTDGSSLEKIRKRFLPSAEWMVVRRMLIAATRCTRIDLTVDIMDEGEFARKISNLCVNDLLKTGRRKATTVRNSPAGTGCTTYIGARTSPKFCRIYDKRAESHGEILSSRIEFEIKAEAAWEVGKILQDSNPLLKASQLFTGLVLDFLQQNDLEEIWSLINGTVESIDLPPREPQMDKMMWLKRQVLPSFDKHRSSDANDLWEWFCKEVNRINE